MKKRLTRQYPNIVIKMGNDMLRLCNVVPSVAVKKAHRLVKDYMRSVYYENKNHEITANVLIGEKVYESVYGFRQNNAIKIRHQLHQ